MIEPLLIEAAVLGLVGSVLLIRQRRRPQVGEPPQRVLSAVVLLQAGDAEKAVEVLAKPGPLERESLRLAWLGEALHSTGRRREALEAWRQGGLTTPAWVETELQESERGSAAADQVVALARQLPTGSERAIHARIRVFEREGRGGDLWNTLLRSEDPVEEGIAGRVVVRALAEGLRVARSDLERFHVPSSVVERGALMREFEKTGAVRRPLEETVDLLATARSQVCSNIVVNETVDTSGLWRDLHGLSSTTSAEGQATAGSDGASDRPSLAIQALAEAPTDQFLETLESWCSGSLRSPLARNICRAGRLRGPKTLQEIARAPLEKLSLDRVRLCVVYLAVRSGDAAKPFDELTAGFARMEVGEAFFVLPFEFARDLLRSFDASLWPIVRQHPRPEPSILFELLDLPEYAARCLDWLRQRPDLVAEHVCEGLLDDARRPTVRRHMHRLPGIASGALLRAMAAESRPVTIWVESFLELGADTVHSFADCAGSPPLEALADWLARRLPSEARDSFRQRIQNSSPPESTPFLERLLTRIGQKSGAGRPPAGGQP